MESSGVVARIAAFGIVGLIVAAPLALGGVRWPGQLLLSGVALLLLVAVAWARLADGGLRLPWPVLGPLALVGLGLAQLLPLPPAVLEVLSPRAHEIYRYGLADLGLYGPGQWRPLSLDPASTWVATGHQAGFAALLLAAANLGRRDGRLVERAIAYGAGLVALVGFVHWTFGLDRIYGVFQPHDVARLTGWFTTFVNANTAAGYLALGALTALGKFAGASDDRTRHLAAASLTVAAVGCFLTGSRGGHVALVFGLLVFAALAHAPSREDEGDTTRARARLTARVALVMGVVGGALALLLLPDWHRTTWDLDGERKVAAWIDARRYVADFWATGSGRGTFGLVFPQYQETLARGTFSHPENIVVQLVSEWGVLGGLAAIVTGVGGWMVALGAVGRAAHPAHWGLVAGLGAAGVQQTVDFGFEAAGLSLPVAAGLGLALGRAARRSDRRPVPRRRAYAFGAAAFALGMIALLAWRGPAAVSGHADAAVAQVRGASGVGAVTETAQAHVARHPADHLLPLTVAAQLAEARAPLPVVMRWVNRALFLFPRGGEAHLLAARALAAANRASQSALEYRLTLQAQPWQLVPLAREIAGRFNRPEHLLQAVPETHTARAHLGEALLLRDPAKARATMEQAIALDPADVESRQVLARACERLKDAACVEAQGHALVERGEPAIGELLLAGAAARRGDVEAARAALASAEARLTADPRLLHQAASVSLRIGDVDGARRAAERLWPLVALDDRQAAKALALRAAIEVRAERHEPAMKAFIQAWERDPVPDYARRAAAEARALGLETESRRLLGLAGPAGVEETAPAD